MRDENIIHVTDYALDVRVGIYSHEQEAPQPLVFNASVWFAPGRKFNDDDFKSTLNYENLVETIRTIAHERHYQLVETLAENIAARILDFPLASHCEINIQKPDAFAHLPLKHISITLIRHKSV